jgi:hypothetical protein
MHAARYQFFAGAGIAKHQNRGFGWGGYFN